MSRLIPVLLLLLPTIAWAADDAIKTDLDAARAAYAKDVEAAKAKLLDGMQGRMKQMADKGDLERTKILKAQLDAFVKDGSLPASPLLASVKATHDTELRAAREKFRKALEAGKVAYTKALKLDEAEAVGKEIKELLDVAKGSAPKDGTPRVIATWRCQIGDGRNAPQHILKFYNNGFVGKPTGPSTWSQEKGVLVMTNPNPAAPKGAWVNICNISRDGKTFRGKNQNGTPIYGQKLADGDIDEKK